MNDFCASCGFLLDLELIKKSKLCRGCKKRKTDSLENGCNCTFCKDGLTNKVNSTSKSCSQGKNYNNSASDTSTTYCNANNNNNNNTDKQQHEKLYGSNSLQRERRRKKEQKSNNKNNNNNKQANDKKQKNTNSTALAQTSCTDKTRTHEQALLVDDSWDAPPPTSANQTLTASQDWGDETAADSWSNNYNGIMDWAWESSCDSNQKADVWDHHGMLSMTTTTKTKTVKVNDDEWGGSSSNRNDNRQFDFTKLEDKDSFFVDTHDKPINEDNWEVVSRKMSRNVAFGDHDFPSLERNLKESEVEERIRAEWEREQNSLKQLLLMRETGEISRLVSGQRRKINGGRYYIGGVDISFVADSDDAVACLSVVQLPDLKLVYQNIEKIKLTQPYIPSFLAFREVPAFIQLFSNLKRNAPQYTPDVIMVDGNGILHPRGFGLASQLGVLLDIPTIGVAKTLMSAQGITDNPAHKEKKHTLLQAAQGFDLTSDSGDILGKCLRSHDQAPNPVYVSVGHKISLNSAVWLVLECSKFRIPEPIRLADLDSRDYIRLGKNKPMVFILD